MDVRHAHHTVHALVELRALLQNCDIEQTPVHYTLANVTKLNSVEFDISHFPTAYLAESGPDILYFISISLKELTTPTSKNCINKQD